MTQDKCRECAFYGTVATLNNPEGRQQCTYAVRPSGNCAEAIKSHIEAQEARVKARQRPGLDSQGIINTETGNLW